MCSSSPCAWPSATADGRRAMHRMRRRTVIHEVTCPRCNHVLRIPAGARDRWLTCPRCLASVGNPNVLVTAAPPAPPVDRPLPPPEEGAGERDCPGCGRAVSRSWRLCPFCEEPLRGAAPPPRGGSLDDEVRGDSRVVGIGLIALGLLGACGIVLFLCGGGLNGLKAGDTREV